MHVFPVEAHDDFSGACGHKGTFRAEVTVCHRVHVGVRTIMDVFVEGCTVVIILSDEAGIRALLVGELGT